MEEARYFLTVDWCQKGNRGIFCDKNGRAFSKGGEPHTLAEMREILGPFWLVLSPDSRQFSEEETARYQNWFPLGEYQGKYGYAVSLEVNSGRGIN